MFCFLLNLNDNAKVININEGGGGYNSQQNDNQHDYRLDLIDLTRLIRYYFTIGSFLN